MMCFMAARRAACSSSVMEGRRTDDVRDGLRRRDGKDGRRGRDGAGASNKCSSGGGAAAAASGARWTGFSSERDVVSMDRLLLF